MDTHNQGAQKNRYLPSGDEIGTAPGDRRFRPDVEGLRAVAVLLVVLFHAGIPRLGGGFVGVDVFYVISGFVITGVLLRERAADNRISILSFYARRCRRIIPAASLVIVVTVVASYAVLGAVGGGRAAEDGKWAAIFLANFHFASVGTNYLTARQAPSPLQNFWSLSVEEQFYLVYPTLFILVARVHWRLSFRARLAIALTVGGAASFALSGIQTSTNGAGAYFSPFTRAWELALGGLVALGTPWLQRLNSWLAASMTWAGLSAIVVVAFWFGANTPYPGWLVSVPVVGAALVIGGGTVHPRFGAEIVLGMAPSRLLGRLSYSLYLWHWPILILAAESSGRSRLPLPQTAGWLLVALLAAVVTYTLVENPIRHARFVRRYRWASVGLGVGLIAVTLSIATEQLSVNAHSDLVSGAAPTRPTSKPTGDINGGATQVERLVASALSIRSVPPNLGPASWGGPPASSPCWPTTGQTSIPSCIFGDLNGNHTMVIYGDSHAAMWFPALNAIAIQTHWRLLFLGHGQCPADMVPIENPPGWGTPGGEYQACDQWRRFAIKRINRVKPNLVIVTQEFVVGPRGIPSTPTQWQSGLEAVFKAIAPSHAAIAVLGNIPDLPESGPECLSQHLSDVQACSARLPDPPAPYRSAEQAAARAASVPYINVLPWFCDHNICPAIIGSYDVYYDNEHVAAPYSQSLEGVLSKAIQLPASADLLGPQPVVSPG